MFRPIWSAVKIEKKRGSSYLGVENTKKKKKVSHMTRVNMQSYGILNFGSDHGDGDDRTVTRNHLGVSFGVITSEKTKTK